MENNFQPQSQGIQIVPYPLWSKFWFVWLVLTIVYLVISFLTTGLTDSPGDPLAFLGSVIGMFVPVGPYTGMGFVGIFTLEKGVTQAVLGIAALILLLWCIVRAHRIIAKYYFSPIHRLVASLILLLILTLLFDLVFWGHWNSLEILRDGGIQ
jgi:hypothetical protein